MMQKLIITSDGSHTIFIPELNEHYHSIHGAVQESRHVFITNGLDFCTLNHLNILEIGFGTGLNALLTALQIDGTRRSVDYTTVEKYPLDDRIVEMLNHKNISGKRSEMIFSSLHSITWNTAEKITDNFTLKKIRGDINEVIIHGNYDLIYFDAFGPEKQPGMWTIEIFEKVSAVTNTGGIFVTYSAKGQVKRNLRSCGFLVSLLPGPPGKRQMIRAIKI
jgi:tRNA U34 5-methylaminomethyl-2-thiouridine-forming methyltransferase MnmC